MKRSWKTRWLPLSILVCASLAQVSCAPPSSTSGYSEEPAITKWDSQFKRWTLAFLPQADWRLIAAQSFQESSWNPLAVSHAGAKGLMQTMPKTHAEIGEQLEVNCSPFSPRCSIMYGVFYDAKMAKAWDRRNRTFTEIIPLMLSSYNCGLGCVLAAQAKANDARDWDDFQHFLPQEPREYPPKINTKYWAIRDRFF